MINAENIAANFQLFTIQALFRKKAEKALFLLSASTVKSQNLSSELATLTIDIQQVLFITHLQ